MVIRDSVFLMPSALRKPLAASAEPRDVFAPGEAAPVQKPQLEPGLTDRLLAGPGLNAFNREVLQILKQHPEREDWFLFCLTNQNYCSPSVPRANTAYQGGILQFSRHIKYLRSEMNTQAFGETYDRNVVLIREKAADSFAELAAAYMVVAPEKQVVRFSAASPLPLKDFLAIEGKKLVLVEGELPVEEILACKDHPGGLYLRVDRLEDRERLQEGLKEGKLQVVVEEAYDPLKAGDSGLRKLSFLHNGSDRLRYQLLQDAASMGYRPGLDEVVRYNHAAARLPQVLDLVPAAEEVSSNREAARVTSTEERDRDYAVLRSMTAGCLMQLNTLKAEPGTLEHKLLELTRREARELAQAVADPSEDVKEVAEVFHRSYARLRNVLQYTVKLAENLAPTPLEALEARVGQLEGGLAVATNSGMSAVRVVTTELAQRVDQLVSTAHYWETDFLLENLAARNPHYPEIADQGASRLKMVSTPEEVQLGDGPALLALDRSISPFFYTRNFPLEQVCSQLKEREHPTYLVVDNTLDFHHANARTLFPEGIPKNVFLIFTASQAKLHQAGLDMTTGGIIQIYAHPSQQDQALELQRTFREKLEQEGSRQTTQGLRLLMQTYYAHHENGTMPAYLGYMLEKRQRNTAALMEQICDGIRADRTSPGQYRVPGVFDVRDPQDPERAHPFEVSFEYDPGSRMHAYLKLLEPPNDKYIAGKVFDEIKRRVFDRAAERGIVLADGTSWGFPTTRMDHYMHTLRIAVGLEHEQTLSQLGSIFSSVLTELLEKPQDFLKGEEVRALSPQLVKRHREAIVALNALIPGSSTAPEDYAQPFSRVLMHRGTPVAIVAAGPRDDKSVYLSKAATDPAFQGKGHFRAMLEDIRQAARARGMERILLQTSASPKNLPVVRAYEKCGFRVTGVEGEMLPNGWPLIMAQMELRLEREPDGPIFQPVPDSVYAACHAAGSLKPLEG